MDNKERNGFSKLILKTCYSLSSTPPSSGTKQGLESSLRKWEGGKLHYMWHRNLFPGNNQTSSKEDKAQTTHTQKKN